MFEVNVVAPRAWVRAAYWAYMREWGGSVVNVTFVAGVRGDRESEDTESPRRPLPI
jgi:hypothetical protein